MIKRLGPPSQGWRTFLRNHAPDIAAMDLFVVSTIGFDLLYAFVIVRLDRSERLIGSIRRKCGDHFIVLGEGAPAPHPANLCLLLQRHQNALVIGRKNATNPSPRSADRIYQFTRNPWRASSPLCAGLGFRYTQVAFQLSDTATRMMKAGDAFLYVRCVMFSSSMPGTITTA